MKKHLIINMIKEEIQFINEYKKLGYNNNDICFLLELNNFADKQYLTEADIKSIFKSIIAKIKQFIGFKKINLNIVKVIINTIKSINFPSIIKKTILSIITLVLLNSAMSSLAQAAENGPENHSSSRQAFTYAAGCIGLASQENSGDLDTKEILINIQNLSRMSDTQQKLDSLDSKGWVETFKWMKSHMGELQNEFKHIVQDNMDKMNNDKQQNMRYDQNYAERMSFNFMSQVLDVGEDVLKATPQYNWKIRSLTTSTNPLENEYKSLQSPQHNPEFKL